MEKFLKEDFPRFVPKVGQITKGAIIGKKGIAVYVDMGPYGTGVIFGLEYYEARELLKDKKMGDEVEVKVKEVENEEGLVELSLKEAGEDVLMNELKRKAETRETFSVKIKGANKGGLTADVAGILAFLPVSQLSSKNYPRLNDADPSKIAKELAKFINTEMPVKILTFDPGKRRIILSEKEIEMAQVREVLKQFKTGDAVEGDVSGVTDFGIFLRFRVRDAKGEEFEHEGLIHASEIKEGVLPKDAAKVGDHVTAKIINIEGDRVYFSLK